MTTRTVYLVICRSLLADVNPWETVAVTTSLAEAESERNWWDIPQREVKILTAVEVIDDGPEAA